MLTVINKQTFASFDDESLASACFKPLITAYKDIESRGGDFSAELYPLLTSGQKALFVFRTHYLHAIQSEADYYWWTAYYLAQTPRWEGLLQSLRHFDDPEMLALLERTEQSLRQRNHPRSLANFDVSLQDIDRDPQLHAEMSDFYLLYKEASLWTYKQIAHYIRLHPEQFVHFE
ncbi:hypothetical protein [Paenibacillus radicis (ex Gao et al. 2016)]|uniref:Uncharacterized protein n=1 Tax=Paenibacillus radicis (ex Gao et al. 2016) TaxID=1737354 RepID=A0A917HFW7_9BACL|nr:hypothetical protein [Paenibacillus radicis (ex Gao et al. 2016)]GGG77482.1 hypothetical protein GCM10010918_37720 [Paenibacillus radicis (ex Gao et al. 2016)]